MIAMIAIAIAEASHGLKASFVAINTLAQQDIQSLDRIRERLIKTHTTLANQLRGLLAEYGVITEKKAAANDTWSWPYYWPRNYFCD
jgi:transposase